jgi:thiopeptide-type bacteriocin biosynthesis protein
VIEHEIKPELESYFLAYFQQHPSQRTEMQQTGARAQGWFPNHTVQFIEYEPELNRYGGPAGCHIAEKQFDASSRAVLRILQEREQWSYERALGAALQLHIGFAFALGMSLTEANQFYSGIFERWLASLVSIEPNETLKAFEEKFAQQRPVLIAHLKTLWNALAEQVEFDQDWFNAWLHDMAITRKELRQAQKKQQLMLSQASQGIWYILHSYVHMTNNRLGILNRDEAYLGYLLKRSFECL